MHSEGRDLPTIAHILLALLARQPASGHELAQRLKNPVGYFWTAPHSQIYPQLAALTDAGLVDYNVESAGETKPRKRYHITDNGTAVLRDWLVSEPAPQRNRDELVLRAYAISLADRSQARELFVTAAEQHRCRLAEYRRAAREIRSGAGGRIPDASEALFGNWAAVQAGIGYESARRRWCEWMIDQLDGATGPTDQAR